MTGIGWVDATTIMFKSGFQALLIGILLYFVVKFVCMWSDLGLAWRIGLTVGCVVLVAIPDLYELGTSDGHRIFGDPDFLSPDQLWLRVQTILIVGPIGHMVGWFIEDRFFT